MKWPELCRHEGSIAQCSLAIPDVIAAIEEGKQFHVQGTCLACGSFIEREYSAGPTLPTLQAELLKLGSLVPDSGVLSWAAGAVAGVPTEIFVVHPGLGLTGACGRNGMALSSIHFVTKEFIYKCKCGFEWPVCAQDIEQMIVQGLHKSMAARRASFSLNPQRHF